jgi:hypothetical protein
VFFLAGCDSHGHGACNSRGLPRSLVSCFESGNRTTDDLPCKALAECQLQRLVQSKVRSSRASVSAALKAILHESAEAFKINCYIHLKSVRIAALGGHETRDRAPAENTTDLARQRVGTLERYPWEELLSARGSGARETALFLARTQGRLSLKELGKLAGGMHHNAVGIAVRRFAERLEKDSALLSKLSLVQKALELR